MILRVGVIFGKPSQGVMGPVRSDGLGGDSCIIRAPALSASCFCLGCARVALIDRTAFPFALLCFGAVASCRMPATSLGIERRQQVATYACIYTSKASNLARVSNFISVDTPPPRYGQTTRCQKAAFRLSPMPPFLGPQCFRCGNSSFKLWRNFLVCFEAHMFFMVVGQVNTTTRAT